MRRQEKVSVYQTNRNTKKSIDLFNEIGLGINEKAIARNRWNYFIHEGKKECAVGGALESPSGFTSTIYEELTYREALNRKMRRYQLNNM